jgi:hypothetical protein
MAARCALARRKLNAVKNDGVREVELRAGKLMEEEI